MKPLKKEYWNLLGETSLSQFKTKDQSTIFGFFWTFLHPLILLLILYLFFNKGLGQQIEHYTIFLLVGIIHYSHFANSTSSAMTVLYSMRELTCNTVFPKEVLVIGSVLSNTMELIMEMVICLTIGYFVGIKISWAMCQLPLIFLLQFMLIMWICILLSSIYIFIKDIAHIYQVFLRALFFMTPIFYSESLLEGKIALSILHLNPLSHLIKFSRDIILKGEMISILTFTQFFMINIIFIYLSLLIFRNLEKNFAEYA
jgi:ABC-type polysaccharide/polyol phosphate export permease